MQYHYKPCTILSADDDPDDQLFMQEAYQELDLNCELLLFPSGVSLSDYVETSFGSIWESGSPCMIFLDLNMPQLNGKETLQYLRQQIQFYSVPVFILSTTTNETDIQECYELGANAVLQKPGDFIQFKQMLSGIYRHWMPFLTVQAGAKHTCQKMSGQEELSF